MLDFYFLFNLNGSVVSNEALHYLVNSVLEAATKSVSFYPCMYLFDHHYQITFELFFKRIRMNLKKLD